MVSRRELLSGALGAAPLLAARPNGLLIDTHIHLFDPKRFPYHPKATYKPEPRTLESYTAFVRQARIDHSVIVHPEPYQDDHSSLEYFFAQEPSRGFFKGTCLFDPVAPETPERMAALVKRFPGRIVALRIHETQPCSAPRTKIGDPIRDRDMNAPAMRTAWRKANDLGLAIQMHFIPCHAPEIRKLAAEFRDVPVVLDHLARHGEGTPAEYEYVLRLSELPRVYMKFSAAVYSSKQPPPHADLKPLLRRVAAAFGEDRIVWGGLGMDMADFEKQVLTFDTLLGFLPEPARARIRGLNAARLYGFPGA